MVLLLEYNIFVLFPPLVSDFWNSKFRTEKDNYEIMHNILVNASVYSKVLKFGVCKIL